MPARAVVLWVCAALGGGVLLHADRLPPWATACVLILLAWRMATAHRGVSAPLAVRAALTLALAALVLLRFRTLNGLSAGTTLLTLMAGLKLTELRRARDLLVIVAAAMFLLLAACLDRQDLWRVPLYALQAWLCCTALALVGATPNMNARVALSLSGRSLLYAMPLAVVLFLFFPRLPGAFWSIPRGDAAVTGLSDSMTPGGIGQLITSYDTAFRVTFAGPAPAPQERYWRGPVLHLFDGRTWRAQAFAAPLAPRTAFTGTAYAQRVVMEPTYQRWWYALDLPARSPDTAVQLSADFELRATTPLTATTAFETLSYRHAGSLVALSAAARRADTALPAGSNPRTAALAARLRQQAGSDAAFAQAALDFLRRGGFQYTLTPERLGADSVDDLLFRTRAGFCGHYASAFATLLRAAGVPARIVTGYLGGEWNPVGGFFIVRQSDAHAWVEAWIEGQGWVRFDPTAVVAPERLRRGVLDLLPQGLSASERLLHASPLLVRLLQRWEAANAWWTDRIVKYNYRSQLQLLGRLGIPAPDAARLGWAFVLGLLLWLAFIAWWIGRDQAHTAHDPLARAYLRLCRKLAAAGVPRALHQGPLDYAAAVRARRPELADRARQLLQRYAQLRYGPPGSAPAREWRDFPRAVKQFRAR